MPKTTADPLELRALLEEAFEWFNQSGALADEALMAIADNTIDWVLEKGEISRGAGRLALLSVLMTVRDLAAKGAQRVQ
jgi:hypothetical protein